MKLSTLIPIILAGGASAALFEEFQNIIGLPHQYPLKVPGLKDEIPEVPILNADRIEDIVPDKYIVVFKDEVDEQVIAEHSLWIRSNYEDLVNSLDSDEYKAMSHILKYRLRTSDLEFFNINDFFKGYSGFLPQKLVKMLQQSKDVKYIERDMKLKVNEYNVQREAPWGLARLSQREQFVSADYEYDTDGGNGVTAYVIDTGIKTNHEEFEDRATWGESIAFPKVNLDANGHGTHCAGIIGSKTYGVAKSVDLVAVSVMNLLGSGVTSDIIKGIEFVVNDHQKKVSAAQKGFKGSVINMSLGGGAQESLDLAINAAVRAGVHVAVAAGNDDKDACEYSPARAEGPITVGASNSNDEKASFSNWGKCVDIFAPGEDILSTYIFGDTTTMSGTSMASPQIAGLLSYFLSLQPDITSEYSTGLLEPALLKEKLIKFGTKGVLAGVGAGSPNILSYNGAGRNLTSLWE